MFLASVRVVPEGSGLWGIVLMPDSCSRASCLHEELFVCPQCTAVPSGRVGVWVLRQEHCRRRVKGRLPCFILQGGEDKTGALSWQGVGPQDTSSCHGEEQQLTKPCVLLQGGRCKGRFAQGASHAPVTHSLFLPDPNEPLPSYADLVS